MDDHEEQQLEEIHEEVKGSHAQLGAINERTRNIERQIERVASEVEQNEEDINKLQGKVKRNTTIVGGFGTAVTAVLVWAADKIMRIV